MSLNISREISNVRYLYIGELTVKQMAFKCNEDKYKVRQFNNIMFAKQFMYIFFMTRLYPASKNKILNVSSFAIQNCVSSSTQIYIKLFVNVNI